MDQDESNQDEEIAQDSLIDIHDVEVLKKLWFMFRDTQKSSEVFALAKLLIDSLPYDFIDKEDNWLHMAHLLEQHGEQELASLFKLANQRAFQLSLKGV